MASVSLPAAGGSCRIGQRTFAGACSSDADARIPDLPDLTPEPEKFDS
jgi:hypothetical protein